MAEVTEADREKARELQSELGWPEMAYPTPEQLLNFLRQCTDVIGVDMATRLLASSEAGHRCWEFDHDGQIQFFRSRARATLEG
jgi:hypothetical protein